MDDRLRRRLQGARAGHPDDRARLRAELGRLANLEDRAGWAEADPAAQDMVLDLVGRLLAPELVPAGVSHYAAGGAAHRIGAFQHQATGVILHLLPGGPCWLGPAPGPGREPVTREVRVGPLLVGRFPLLQSEWDRLGGEDQRSFVGPDLPIEGISWHAAQDWLRRAGGELRLPSEAEWEYAAGGASQWDYPWGPSLKAANGTPGNFASPRSELIGLKDDVAFTAPAGSFPAGVAACGALDLAGNVSEWVADWFGPLGEEPVTDPQGARSGDFRVHKGGSWRTQAGEGKRTNRFYAAPGEGAPDRGFRLAISPPP